MTSTDQPDYWILSNIPALHMSACIFMQPNLSVQSKKKKKSTKNYKEKTKFWHEVRMNKVLVALPLVQTQPSNNQTQIQHQEQMSQAWCNLKEGKGNMHAGISNVNFKLALGHQ